MKELKIIEYILKEFSKNTKDRRLVKGIGDDCAVISHRGSKHLLLTTDMIIEGTHFTKRASPFSIGWKSMAVNISDIAAMGGLPKYALISLGIPGTKNLSFIKSFTKGVKALASKFGIRIVGGDINASDKIVVNVALIGEVEKKNMVTRSGAAEGDLVFMTGTLGEGARKHLSFMPRLPEARKLATGFRINSMIDMSDGLAMDLNRLAKASSVGARIYKGLIPLGKDPISIDKAISSGEDFELLFTADISESKKIITRMGKKEDLPVTLIGEIVDKKNGVKLINEDGSEEAIRNKGFRHL